MAHTLVVFSGRHRFRQLLSRHGLFAWGGFAPRLMRRPCWPHHHHPTISRRTGMGHSMLMLRGRFTDPASHSVDIANHDCVSSRGRSPCITVRTLLQHDMHPSPVRGGHDEPNPLPATLLPPVDLVGLPCSVHRCCFLGDQRWGSFLLPYSASSECFSRLQHTDLLVVQGRGQGRRHGSLRHR